MQRARAGEQLAEEPLALHERQRAQVEILEADQVEDEERRRQLQRCALDVGRPLEESAALEPLEARPRPIVEAHHLAVQDQVPKGSAATARAISGKTAVASLPLR